MNNKPLTAASTRLPPISLREQSVSTIQTAIHSPHDEGKTLERANAVLSLYFDPDHDPKTRAAVRSEFVNALREFPDWAVQRAFDSWVKTGTRRPTPGEIAILAQREIKPLVDELAERRKRAQAAQERYTVPDKPDPETATRIMQEAGFTPRRMEAIRRAPMATSFDAAEGTVYEAKTPHWSEKADPDGPEWRALRAARDNNELIRQARATVSRARADDEGSAA